MNQIHLDTLKWLNTHSGFARINLGETMITGYDNGKQSSRPYRLKIWASLIRGGLVTRKWVHRSHFELTITAKGKAYLS